MKILVGNVGSTSLKFKLFDMPVETLLCEGKVERVGSHTEAIFYYKNHKTEFSVEKENCSSATYSEGIRLFLDCLTDPEKGVISEVGEISAVGFKTVLAKGFYGIHELNEEVLHAMEEYLFIAPAHNKPYLEAIARFRELMPKAKMVGVFETAFHTTIPLERRMYAIPYEWYEKYDIKRMGYHGASHSYVAQVLEKEYGGTGRAISCHLGGSCSVCAIEDGKSVDSSFGFSLQTGIPHASRSGDVDSYIIPFLLNEGMQMDEILTGLSKNGGLLGISGVSNDLREIEKAMANGNERAKLAVDVFAASIIRHIGAYYAELGGLDRIVFTGGIGENSSLARSLICSRIAHMGIILDEEANRSSNKNKRIISSKGSKAEVMIIPANEEIGLARHTYDFVLNN
jgi:acetate kinase